MITTPDDIDNAITRLNLNNKVIFTHCAMRSLGTFDGGANALLSHFLSAGCTVVAPTFTYAPMCLSPEGKTYPQNGYRGELEVAPSPFDEHANDIEPSMGAFARAVLHHPNRVRTTHPINSFAAVGPLAGKVLSPQTDTNVYGIYQSKDVRGALVLSIGVKATSLTPIHYAEQRAGKRLFRRWALTKNRGVVETCIGSCSNGFEHLNPALERIQARTNVGASLWTRYPLEALLEVCTLAITTAPSITQCSKTCVRCQDMVLGGAVTP